jgi:XRE family aerobic/anaerobic benzoate catabolism transcriptional regulator
MLQKAVTHTRQPQLVELGARVRRLRNEQRWSRRQLAEKSGVSERFLAQLENGTGNISVLRLCAIARALGTAAANLLGGLDMAPDQHAKQERIALIGLRGAGKTTLGRVLAKRLALPFVELTDRIERQSGLSVAEIFNLYGNEGYRQLERAALQAVIDEDQPCVVATAGGIIEDAEAFELLLGAFFTIWLTATPDEHMARVRAQGDLRPMAGDAQAMQALKAILGARSHAYARADAILDTSGRKPNVCTEELQALLHNKT